jgi:hypothetical protein
MSLIRCMDRVLFAWLTRSWPRERIERYVETLRASNDESTLPTVVFRNFESIDAKAAALLTHTSMMVAALGVTSALVAESHSQEAVIVFEILIYLIISILCLRCISLFHEPSEFPPEALSEVARNELILRRGLFTLCNRATIYVTFLVLFSLPILFII